jgi:hypothetical protein
VGPPQPPQTPLSERGRDEVREVLRQVGVLPD